jgi:hypothetical protein
MIIYPSVFGKVIAYRERPAVWTVARQAISFASWPVALSLRNLIAATRSPAPHGANYGFPLTSGESCQGPQS